MSAIIELAAMPSLLSLYRKVFFHKKPGWDGQLLPETCVHLPNHKLNLKTVAAYNKACGFENQTNLAVSYLYTQVFRLHVLLFTHESVTFPALGLIHLKNSISQYKSIPMNSSFDLRCQFANSNETDKGLEFDLESKAYVDGELVWSATSTYLYRVPGKVGKRSRPARGSDMDWSEAKLWQLPQKSGIEYAMASGDFNVIHLHPVLAKPFGFDRVLAHGMWSKAKCIAALPSELTQGACQVDVEFKLPLLLPNDVSFHYVPTDDGCRFELRDPRGRRPHLVGTVKPL
ncbi:MaoC/PaaZ C-terminal domain-containing protein [Paraferrimonas sp. SM1919]|uniref:MaoC/PaaZ C-terminal domain-containing protein n=1 Tax=Paraferrimonas sp. SM1919 TaxID=2662263 RepID=UPI0013D83F41|nr:MaoC/PaaZ C-terminal domain-containing protein [Paraferrimonas sp. SM1919]